MASRPKPKYEQDAFDKAFLKVLHELQSFGFAKNVKKLEEHLHITKNTFYQVRNGSRGVPKMYRDRIKSFFVEKYRINPKVFEQHNARIFTGRPPMANEVDEHYQQSDKNVTSGTLAELTKIKAENQLLKAKLEQQSAGFASKMSEAFVSRSMAFQEVVLEALAGIGGTSFEDLFSKVRNKEVELEAAFSGGDNPYSNRTRHNAGGASS